MAGGNGQDFRSFPVTHWSSVERAGQGQPDRKREALGKLLVRYLPALRAYLVLKKRIPYEKAEDLLHDFVVNKVLEKDIIARADKDIGKFRTFLLTALDRFVSNRLRDEKAKKRNPAGGLLISVDDGLDPPDGSEGPADVFDVAWAREVIAEALRRMEAECVNSERTDIWAIFECRILQPTLEGTKPLDYREIVGRFGFKSPTQAANALITAKRMYQRYLRSVIAEYAEDDQVDSEIEELKQILAGRGA